MHLDSRRGFTNRLEAGAADRSGVGGMMYPMRAERSLACSLALDSTATHPLFR